MSKNKKGNTPETLPERLLREQREEGHRRELEFWESLDPRERGPEP